MARDEFSRAELAVVAAARSLWVAGCEVDVRGLAVEGARGTEGRRRRFEELGAAMERREAALRALYDAVGALNEGVGDGPG